MIGERTFAVCRQQKSKFCRSKNGETCLIFNKSLGACDHCNHEIKQEKKVDRKVQSGEAKKEVTRLLSELKRTKRSPEYKKVYWNFFGFSVGEFVPCEICGQAAVDIHHIDCDGMGGSDRVPTIEELMALCRKGHDKFGDKKQFKEILYYIHFQYMKLNKPNYEPKIENTTLSGPFEPAIANEKIFCRPQGDQRPTTANNLA